ncbi:MAG: 6-phosphofructokinase [Succinivibrionaceae bacterium]
MNSIKKIGVLTSGGDAPGMNAVIRAVVRAGIAAKIEVFGIKDGFLGLYENRIEPMNYESVTDIINLGGTILGTARFKSFSEESVRAQAISNARSHGLDAIVVIGGDGSYMGALRLSEMGLPSIGIPGTIDNDVSGTDFTIGFDTALNTVVECIDRLIDTCNSHRRVVVVEIMGRHCGDLAMHASIATGSDFVVIPELPYDRNAMIQHLQNSFAHGKRHGVIAVCENTISLDSIAKDIENTMGIECRTMVLGHLQRGGKPTPKDRILGSRFGTYAVDLLLSGISGECIGIIDNQLVHNKIVDGKAYKHKFNDELSTLASRLV